MKQRAWLCRVCLCVMESESTNIYMTLTHKIIRMECQVSFSSFLCLDSYLFLVKISIKRDTILYTYKTTSSSIECYVMQCLHKAMTKWQLVFEGQVKQGVTSTLQPHACLIQAAQHRQVRSMHACCLHFEEYVYVL